MSLIAFYDWCEAVVRNGGPIGSPQTKRQKRKRKRRVRLLVRARQAAKLDAPKRVLALGWDRCVHGVHTSWRPCTECNAIAAAKRSGG